MELLTELRHGNPMAEKYWEQFMMKLRRNGLKDSILTIERGRLTGDKRIIFPKGLNVGIGTQFPDKVTLYKNKKQIMHQLWNNADKIIQRLIYELE